MAKGKLIVIDGSDASGKNTQVKLLKEKLEADGHKVEILDFPRYGTFFGDLVSSYLNGELGDIKSVNPKVASLLYALDRYAEKDRIKQWIDEGNVIILDRYVESNLGYQGAKDPKIITWIEELEYEKLGLPKPDLVFYLHVPLEISKGLMESRPDKEYIKDKRKDIHEMNLDFLEQVQKNYLKMVQEKRWIKIDCTSDGKLNSKEEISEVIYDIIKKEFHQK
jgi:dTMP kinase